MTSLVDHVKKSLFFRLLLIFGATVLLIFVIIFTALRAVNQEGDDIESIPDYFTRQVDSIINDIGTPPNLGNAVRLANELGWTINIRNPIMRWSSDAEYRLDVDASEYSETLTSDAEVRTVGDEDIIMVKRGGYDFYMYQRARNPNSIDFFILYVGLALAAAVLIFSYIAVNKLLDPLRLLRSGAERIEKGDLNYRVKTDRQDELGELTVSINHMADSLQSMLEAKRQLLMAISHELRTPITKAKLRLEFMPETDEREQLREDIDEVELLISDLLEAERLNGEHAVLVPEPVELGGFVSSIVEQLKSHDSHIEVEVPEQDEEFVIDKLRIRLLINNLLNNAIRHGEDKPILIRVSCVDDRGLIEVIDNGEGIAEKHLSQISEPFYRADSSRQRDTGGFGLGLYLCRLIAEAHGGKLDISSKLGEGTHITVNIPRQPPGS